MVDALSPSRVFIVGNDGQQMRLVIIRHLGSEVRTIRDLLITWLSLTDASKSLLCNVLKLNALSLSRVFIVVHDRIGWIILGKLWFFTLQIGVGCATHILISSLLLFEAYRNFSIRTSSTYTPPTLACFLAVPTTSKPCFK